MMKLTKKAFTLIELMIVIAIIAIIAAVIIPVIINKTSEPINIEQTIDLNEDQDSGSKL